jgi:hypothetical protein
MRMSDQQRRSLHTRHRGDVPRTGAHAVAAALALLALTASAARADVTASYDGTLTPKAAASAIVSGGLAQTGKDVLGTWALSTEALTDVYAVIGKAKKTKVKLKGTSQSGTGAKLTVNAKLSGTTLQGKAKIKGPGVSLKGSIVMTPRADVEPEPPESCDSQFFEGQVMGHVLTICQSCHIDGGTAQNTTFRVTPNDPQATQASVALHINRHDPASSRILQKPLQHIPHGGGLRIIEGSEEHQILEEWVNLVAAGEQCATGPQVELVPIAAHELLMRASMDLRGMRPSVAELDAVESDASSYERFVDQYLAGPEFLERVKDVYDDALLVRREDDDDDRREETAALYGEALELIAYIVKNDRPFTEIGNGNYTVANATFQSNPDRLAYPMMPVTGAAWQPTTYLDGRPHGGLLSTSAFYSVWDTNNTNVNRRRANRWSIVFHCYNFLDTPVDVTRDVDNNDQDAVLSAVTTRQDCRACHDTLDPLASFIFPLDHADRGFEDGDPENFFSADAERWRWANKRPPAVYGQPGQDLRDLGRLLVEHPRFAECQTQRAFEMLFLRKPQTNGEITTVREIANHFAGEDHWVYRKMVRRLMTSDVYKSRPVDGDPRWVRRTSPERLERLVEDLTGFVWTREAGSEEEPLPAVPLLTSEEDGYRIILGGINGYSVTGRNHALNASVSMVARKVATVAGNATVEQDLSLPDGQRKLLRGVRGDENPADDEEAIRGHLSRIARRLYGNHHPADGPYVDVWWNLFQSLYQDGTQSGEEEDDVAGTRSERAWRGVLIAMLRSPKLLIY